MNRIAKELDEQLRRLDPQRAQNLVSLVRAAIDRVSESSTSTRSEWPDAYFEQTAGAFAAEPFERSPQGELPRRDQW